MVIYGPSGIGKTKLAQIIGKIYGKCGILVRGNCREVTKQDLTTGYVNESSAKTRRVLLNGLESVVFIDEAYNLLETRHRIFGGLDHGSEAVTELVNFLDKHVGLSIVIAAGYKKQMQEGFIGANEGMARRFPHIIDLPEYNSKELFQICANFLKKSSITLNDEQAGYLWGCIDTVYQKYPHAFDKQAGDVLNLSGIIGRQTYGLVDVNFSNDYRYIISESMKEFAKTKGIDLNIAEYSSITKLVPRSRYQRTT